MPHLLYASYTTETGQLPSLLRLIVSPLQIPTSTFAPGSKMERAMTPPRYAAAGFTHSKELFPVSPGTYVRATTKSGPPGSPATVSPLSYIHTSPKSTHSSVPETSRSFGGDGKTLSPRPFVGRRGSAPDIRRLLTKPVLDKSKRQREPDVLRSTPRGCTHIQQSVEFDKALKIYPASDHPKPTAAVRVPEDDASAGSGSSRGDCLSFCQRVPRRKAGSVPGIPTACLQPYESSNADMSPALVS